MRNMANNNTYVITQALHTFLHPLNITLVISNVPQAPRYVKGVWD